jgi:hypothetical protein
VSQSLFHASLAASTACAACARVCVAPPILCCLLFIIIISCMEIERNMVVYTLLLACCFAGARATYSIIHCRGLAAASSS